MSSSCYHFPEFYKLFFSDINAFIILESGNINEVDQTIHGTWIFFLCLSCALILWMRFLARQTPWKCFQVDHPNQSQCVRYLGFLRWPWFPSCVWLSNKLRFQGVMISLQGCQHVHDLIMSLEELSILLI